MCAVFHIFYSRYANLQTYHPSIYVCILFPPSHLREQGWKRKLNNILRQSLHCARHEVEKVKLKFILSTPWRNRNWGTFPLVNLGSRWRWVANFILPPFTPRNKTDTYWIDEPHIRSGQVEEEKTLLTLKPRTVQPVTHWIRYSGSCVTHEGTWKMKA
jgi:hypothetical protein